MTKVLERVKLLCGPVASGKGWQAVGRYPSLWQYRGSVTSQDPRTENPSRGELK